MVDIEGIRFKNNGITDSGAALLLKACTLCPKFRAFNLEKNEISDVFVSILKEVVTEN